jgi:predicted ArsR family transcriptional regulator
MKRVDALGDPGLREVLAFVRGRPDPPAADDVAEGLALPRSVARWRLERLVEGGLLEPAFVRRSRRSGPGSGRPAKTYSVTPETVALEFPRRRYEELVRLLIETLPTRGRKRRLDSVGLAFGRELARTAHLQPSARPATGLDRLCRALGALGFQTSVESLTSERAVLVTPTCPLRPLVVEAPAARDLDQGMWRGLVGEGLEQGARARCETHDCLSAGSPCRIVIQLDG